MSSPEKAPLGSKKLRVTRSAKTQQAKMNFWSSPKVEGLARKAIKKGVLIQVSRAMVE